MKQYSIESNDTYLQRFKSMMSTSKITGSDHIFVSKEMLNKEIKDATVEEINEERYRFVEIFHPYE